MRKSYHIRPAQPEDVGRMAELWGECCAERVPGEKHDLPAWATTISGLMARNEGFVSHVVVYDGAIVGFQNGIVFYETDRSIMQLLGMHTWLQHAHRGQGVGRTLYDVTRAAAMKLGAVEFISAGEPMSMKYVRELHGEEMKVLKTYYVGRL